MPRPATGKGGTIYVPASLVTNFKVCCQAMANSKPDYAAAIAQLEEAISTIKGLQSTGKRESPPFKAEADWIAEHPPFRLEVWCLDCAGEDFEGCFEGGTEILDEFFSTPDEAIEQGWKRQPNATHPWRFRVIDDSSLDIRKQFRESRLLHPWSRRVLNRDYV